MRDDTFDVCLNIVPSACAAAGRDRAIACRSADCRIAELPRRRARITEGASHEHAA
ncbi:hypothetical protein BURMUCF2_2612 [Burkholderia multivorans CF2]|nr:hypothetical protein BURMUCF2_2612 [Burkholderia multivorans CF2]